MDSFTFRLLCSPTVRSGAWCAPREGLSTPEERKIPCLCRETNSGSLQFQHVSLYQLRYFGVEIREIFLLLIFFKFLFCILLFLFSLYNDQQMHIHRVHTGPARRRHQYTDCLYSHQTDGLRYNNKMISSPLIINRTI